MSTSAKLRKSCFHLGLTRHYVHLNSKMSRTTALLLCLLINHGTVICDSQSCKRKIFVSHDFTIPKGHCTNSTQNSPWQCRSLNDVLEEPGLNLSDACIYLKDNEIWLRKSLQFENVHGLKILKSASSKVTIDCQCYPDTIKYHNGSGVSFFNSSNIVIEGVEFKQCGAKKKIKLCNNLNATLFIASALHFDKVENISLFDVTVLQSYGFGVHLLDSGRITSFQNISIQNNSLAFNYDQNYNKIDGFSSGGAIRIEFSGLSKFSNQNEIKILDSLFQNNVAEDKSGNNTCPPDRYYPFGRGGALSIIFNGNSSSNHILVNNTHFINNTALWAGSINIKFDDNSRENRVWIASCLVNSSSAKLYGGGIFIAALGNENKNRFNITETSFHGNTAVLGGALALMDVYAMYDDNDSIRHNNFTQNIATGFGSAIFIKDSDVKLSNIYCFNNSNIHGTAEGIGTIATFRSIVTFLENNNISDNTGTGILLDTTQVKIGDSLNLENNRGVDGGGMAVYGNTRINFISSNSHLNFAHNNALSRGGGLFVSVPGPYIYPTPTILKLNRYDCVFSPDYGNVIFNNNKANKYGGNAIFYSTLQHCTTSSIELSDAFNWTNFNFSPSLKNDSYAIVTQAMNLTLDINDWQPSPGITLKPSFNIEDERGTSISGILDIYTAPSTALGSTREFNVDKDEIDIEFVGNISENFNISVLSLYSEIITHNISNVAFQDCPFGFHYQRSKLKCICDKTPDFARAIAQCIGSNLYIMKGYWIHGSQAHTCPSGYCAPCNVTLTGFECKLELSRQCNENRNQDSTLCSECLGGYSTVFLDDKCYQCSSTHNIALLIFVILAVAAALSFILMYVMNSENYQEHVNNTNAFIFFYGCTVAILSKNGQLRNFACFSTHVPFKDGVCLFNGMTNLDKLWIQFIFPLIIIFPLLGIYCFMKITNQEFKFITKKNCLRALNNFSITCTFLLMRYAFTALQAVYIDDGLRVYIYAKELYMGSKHLPHFIFSVIILICAVCYMIVNFMLLLQNNNGNNRAGFKRAQSKVTILVYVACFLIVMVFIVFLPKYFQGMCTSILFLLMTFFMSILKAEYEEERGGVNVAINRNYFSFYSLINMSCLTALTLAYGNLEGIYCPKITLSWECKFLFVIIGILFYIPLFGLMVYVVYQYVNEPIRDCCRRNEYNLVGKRKHLFSSLFI